jgi:NADH-quinone oxidoreductase subunit M
LTPEGLNGSIFQLVSHGVLAAMLFLIVGVLYDRTHDRRIENYRGLSSKMPNFTILTAIAFFASLGLPTFSGFIGEFFSLMGAFQSAYLPKTFTVFAIFGIVLSAAYFLWAFRKMFFGKFWVNHGAENLLTDLDLREKILLISLAIMTLLLGIFPQLIFDITNKSVAYFF